MYLPPSRFVNFILGRMIRTNITVTFRTYIWVIINQDEIIFINWPSCPCGSFEPLIGVGLDYGLLLKMVITKFRRAFNEEVSAFFGIDELAVR